MDNFAQKLQAARKAAGLSQQGMAGRTLIPRRTLQDWEQGLRTPPPYVQRFVLNELESLKRKEGQLIAARKRPLTEEMQKTQKAIYTLLCVSGYVEPGQSIDAVEVRSTSNQGHAVRFMGEPVGVLRYKTGVLELAHAPHIPLYAEWLTDIRIRKNEYFGWEAHPSTKKQIVDHQVPGLYED